MAEELDPMTHLPEEGDPIKTKSSDDFLKQLGKNLVKPTLGTTITTKRDGINLGGSFEIENSNVGGIFDYSKKADVKSYLGTEFAAQNMEELNKAIAENQTWTSELGRTAANLIPNIAAGILENVGYIAELPGAILGYDQDFNNGLTEWAKENRNPFGEIYRKDPNAVIDTSDSAWWFEQGGGLVESIGEFAAFGMGVGGGLGKISSGIARGVNAGSKVTRGLKALGQVGTSASLAYTEGAMSGATVFEEVYGKEYSKLAELGVDPLEADRLARVKAAESAVTTVKLNTAINTMLNMSSVIPFSKMSTMRKAEKYGINRAAGESDNAFLARLNEAKAKGIGSTASKSVQRYTGEAIQESAEELTNVVAERVGLDTEGEKSFTEHLEEAFKSEEGFLSMALGAIGGVGQTGITRRLPTQKTPQLDSKGQPVTDKDGKIVYDRISRRKLEKQTDTNAHADFITSITDDLNNFQKLTTDLRSAVQKGDKNKIKQIKRDLFNISASNAIRKGAGEELKESYRQIANLSADDAVKAGLAENPNDTEYKQLAQEAIEDITEADKQWKAFANKYNYGDEEAVGLGKHVFNTWLAKQGHQKTSKQLRRENELLKNKIEGEDAEGIVDAFVAVQTLEKELELQEAELQEVKKIKKEKGKKGRNKLKNKYGTGSVNDISAIIEKNSEKIALQLLEAQEKLKQIKLDYIEADANEYNAKKEEHDAKYTKLNKAQQQQDDAQISKGKRKKVKPVPYPVPKKSEEDLMEELFSTTQSNANTLGDISTNESYAKHFDKLASILEGSLTEITSSKGRTAFVKAARKDLNEKIEEQKKSEEKAKSKEGKAKTAARKAKAKAKPKGDNTGEEPTAVDISEITKKQQESSEGKSEARKEREEIAKAMFNLDQKNKGDSENSPMFAKSAEDSPMFDFSGSRLMEDLLMNLEKEGLIDPRDFKAVAAELNDILGAKAFASIFPFVRSLYHTSTGNAAVMGPEFEYSQIFRTNEEQEEIDSDAISLPVNNSTKEMEIKDYEKLMEEVEDAVINNTGDDSVEIKDNKGNIIGLGDLIVPAGTAFAYLSQEYEEQTFKSGRIRLSKKTTSSNELLDSMQEPLLLSPNHYQPGEKVTIREAKEFQTVDRRRRSYL